jgi:hypothetical protein
VLGLYNNLIEPLIDLSRKQQIRSMALNLATSEVGVTVSSFTSACPGCPASNTLVDAPERVWLSEPSSVKSLNNTSDIITDTSSPSPSKTIEDTFDLTQSLTLDFVQLSTAQPSVAINTAGIYCWHSYSSNPKVFSVHASVDGEKYFLAGKYIGRGKPSAGLILFSLENPIYLQNVRYVRFDFEETYGGNQVYVNRLHLYESTPDVVKLFVNDRLNVDDSPVISTPATTEATSMFGEQIDDSLEKLQESLVYQYSSGLDDSLNDLALSNVLLRNSLDHGSKSSITATTSTTSTTTNNNSKKNKKTNKKTNKDNTGFGVHLHRSGSMDIHIPSSIAYDNGQRPTTHVRIHGGNSTLSSDMLGRDEPLPVLQGKSSMKMPELSSWEISQAVRKPLSEQLNSMCEQVAELADRRGIREHKLRAFDLTKEKDRNNQDNGVEEEYKENNNKQNTANPNENALLLQLQTSLSSCVRQASSLEERVAFIESEMDSMKQMMRKLLESTGADATGKSVQQPSSSKKLTEANMGVIKTKHIVVDLLKRWEKDMVTSVFEPSVRNAIRKFESKLNKRLSILEHSINDKQQEKRAQESKTAWAVGADIRTEQMMLRVDPIKSSIEEQNHLVSRLQEKMEEKAKTLRLIENLKRSSSSEIQ